MHQMEGVREDLEVDTHSSLHRVYRLNDGQVRFATISGITNAAPAVVTATGHGLPTGWRVSVHAVSGMDEINADRDPPRERDVYTITSTGANTLQLDGVNTIGYGAYTSGGALRYLHPFDLTSGDAELVIYDALGGTALTTWNVTGGQFSIDTSAKTVTLTVTPTALQALTWTTGWYEFRYTDSSDVVWLVSNGQITLTD